MRQKAELPRGWILESDVQLLRRLLPQNERWLKLCLIKTVELIVIFRASSFQQNHHLEPAYEAFLKTQDVSGPPCGLFFQSEHSKLAGALASALSSDIFGPLPAEVLAAITEHDRGWDGSDAQQLGSLTTTVPQSFTAVSAEDTLPCWIGSIAHGRTLGPLAELLISRHCCLLGTGSGKHTEFVNEETKHRYEIEASLPYTSQEYDRWTAALGFCDLLSLYLCSGSQISVELPLAHPELKLTNRILTLHWADGQPSLSEPIFKRSAGFRANGVTYAGLGRPTKKLLSEWNFSHQLSIS